MEENRTSLYKNDNNSKCREVKTICYNSSTECKDVKPAQKQQ